MHADANPVPKTDTAKGLPAVAPPSGKFIAQLFLVPLAIVCGCVLIYYVGRGLTVGFRAPDVRPFLEQLRDSNPEIRWRGADGLALLLQKDLAGEVRFVSNPELALDLADLLDEAAKNHDPTEQAIRDSLAKLAGPDADKERERLLKKLEMERSYLEYLTACVGHVMIPAGAPLLSDMALKKEGASEETILLRRRQAVWSLANLGRNLERFTSLPVERQEEVLAQLNQEIARPGKRGDWARKAHDCLAARRQGNAMAIGLDATLAECAKAENPELRKMVALALTYWQGNVEENQLMEQTLVKLAHDDGFGASDDQRLRSLEVRYHAALALARRGSDKTPFQLLAEMLNEEQLERNLRRRHEGRDLPDRDAAQATLANALKVVTELHARQPERDLSKLYPALEQLTRSSQAAVRVEAERVLRELGQR
jgi:hypothetical protein